MKIGVTLSGGFLKGVAHCGFLSALEYKGLSPSFIAGSSAGAVVGLLYAAGYGPEEILNLSREYSWKKLVKPSLRGAFFSLDGLHSALLDLVGEVDISELKIPFRASVVNLETLKVEFPSRGRAVDIVTASCSIPPLFSPRKVGRNYYFDGGVRNCLPAELPKAYGVSVNICSNVNVLSRKFSPDSLFDVSFRVSLAGVLENQEGRYRYCDIIVNHRLTGNPFDFSSVEDFYRQGYEVTLEVLEREKLWP